MIKIKKILPIGSNIKINPDIWFFFLFLFTFTFTIRKVLFYFPIKGTFNEYADISIYLSDIFLFITICLWLFVLLYNNSIIQSIRKLWITSLQHNIFTWSILIRRNKYIILPLALVIWAILSISWSNHKPIAIFRSLKLIEWFLLYLYIALRFIPKLFHVEHYKHNNPNANISYNVPRGTLYEKSSDAGLTIPPIGSPYTKHCSTWNIIFSLMIAITLFHSLIAILQFVSQQSVGLPLLGESLISPSIPGVAKIAYSACSNDLFCSTWNIYQSVIRAYGLFPHPNILGGYLLISIITTLAWLKMFHVEHLSQKNKSVNNTNVSTAKMFHVEQIFRHTPLYRLSTYILLTIQLIALILTASKSAMLALGLALFYLNVPRGTFWRDARSFITNRQIILIVFIVILIILISSNFLTINFWQSVSERISYLNVSRGTIYDNPITGVGIGQFIINMPQYSQSLLEIWQYQPVHNVYLLIWSELGLIGLVIFLLFIYNILRPINKINVPRETNLLSSIDKNVPRETYQSSIMGHYHKYLQSIIIGFLFIMLWDHYTFDIQQGEAAMWLIFGLAAGIAAVKDKKRTQLDDTI